MDKAELVVTTTQPEYGLGMRHLQAMFAFLGLSTAFLMRLNLSVAIVQMSTSTQFKVEMGPGEKALVLSSFFWGYGLLQIPLGHFGRKGYAVKLTVFENMASGILSLLVPLAALNVGPIGICVVRFLLGLVQGGIYPNLYNVMAIWVTPQERESVANIIYAGPAVGTLICMVLSGFLGYKYDWPSIFYFSGLIAIVIGIIHLLVGSEGPEVCKWISPEEKEFMKQCFKKEDKQVHEKKAAIPWKEIMTSAPFLAYSFTTWCNCWGGWTIATLTPTYISGVLHFDLADDGLLSALPQIGSCLAIVISTLLASYLKKRHNVPISLLRPLWNSIAMYGATAALLTLGYTRVDAPVAITLLVITVSILTFIGIGHQMNPMDLAPNFSGILMSIANTIGNTASIAGPLISTYLVKDTGDVSQWRIVFILSAMLFFLGNTVYLFWGSTMKQPWDDGKRSETPSV